MEGGRRGAWRVMIIEDHGALGRFIAATLSSAGWSVIGQVCDHAAAMEAARHRQFELAIIDRMLQGEDSFGIAEAIIEREIGVLLISGYPRSSLPERFHNLPYLEKPFAVGDLLAAVEAIADGRR
jgi:DNA-binding response OmpR family regulator